MSAAPEIWLHDAITSPNETYFWTLITASTAVSILTNVRNLREHNAIVDFSCASFKIHTGLNPLRDISLSLFGLLLQLQLTSAIFVGQRIFL